MSWNLIAAVEQEEHGREVRPMILVRAAAGITHSAVVAKGDIVSFNGLDAKVIAVRHKHQPPGGQVAPTSEAHVSFSEPLADFEIEKLVEHGFRDMG